MSHERGSSTTTSDSSNSLMFQSVVESDHPPPVSLHPNSEDVGRRLPDLMFRSGGKGKVSNYSDPSQTLVNTTRQPSSHVLLQSPHPQSSPKSGGERRQPVLPIVPDLRLFRPKIAPNHVPPPANLMVTPPFATRVSPRARTPPPPQPLSVADMMVSPETQSVVSTTSFNEVRSEPPHQSQTGFNVSPSMNERSNERRLNSTPPMSRSSISFHSVKEVTTWNNLRHIVGTVSGIVAGQMCTRNLRNVGVVKMGSLAIVLLLCLLNGLVLSNAHAVNDVVMVKRVTAARVLFDDAVHVTMEMLRLSEELDAARSTSITTSQLLLGNTSIHDDKKSNSTTENKTLNGTTTTAFLVHNPLAKKNATLVEEMYSSPITLLLGHQQEMIWQVATLLEVSESLVGWLLDKEAQQQRNSTQNEVEPQTMCISEEEDDVSPLTHFGEYVASRVPIKYRRVVVSTVSFLHLAGPFVLAAMISWLVHL